MPMQQPATRRHDLPSLTSVRFFAAFWVLLFHVRELGLWTGGPAWYASFVHLGYVGVSFFFVLSGFILVYVYEGRPIPKSRFWQARFARIYPAYLFSLLVTIGAPISFWSYLTKLHVRTLVLVSYPLLIEAWFPGILFFWNAVAWSLSVEAFFYLLFPYLMSRLAKLDRKGLSLWILSSWLLSLAFTFTYVLLRPDGVAHTTSLDNQLFWLGVVKFNPLLRLPEFLLGMGAGSLFLRSSSRPLTWPFLLGVGGTLLVIALQFRLPYPVIHSGLLAPAFALIIFALATEPAWSRVLAAKPLLLLGEASYSLYLLHIFPIEILAFLMKVGNSPHIYRILAIYLAAILLVSVLVYLFLERPLRRLLQPRQLPPPLDSPSAQFVSA